MTQAQLKPTASVAGAAAEVARTHLESVFQANRSAAEIVASVFLISLAVADLALDWWIFTGSRTMHWAGETTEMNEPVLLAAFALATAGIAGIRPLSNLPRFLVTTVALGLIAAIPLKAVPGLWIVYFAAIVCLTVLYVITHYPSRKHS